MKTRWIPILAASASLCASVFIWPVRDAAPEKALTFADVTLPSANEMPEPMELPERITLFDTLSNGRDKTVVLSSSPTKTDAEKSSYRLCAFAGGETLWVVSIEDSNGHYFTIRSGELLPMTTLEFKGMQFRTTPYGAQEGTALFFDRAKSKFVDVTAQNDRTSNAPSTRTSNLQ